MSMIIGGATVALVESRHGGMNCEAYPSRLALVLAVIDNGGISLADSYHGSDGHKAALEEIAQKVAEVRSKISAREEWDAQIEQARESWMQAATARYMDAGGLDQDEAVSAASSLFALIVNAGDGLPDAAEAADEDMATWTT